MVEVLYSVHGGQSEMNYFAVTFDSHHATKLKVMKRNASIGMFYLYTIIIVAVLVAICEL